MISNTAFKELSATEIKLFLFLKLNLDAQNKISYKDIMDGTGYTKKTISLRIRDLEKKGYIAITKDEKYKERTRYDFIKN